MLDEVLVNCNVHMVRGCNPMVPPIALIRTLSLRRPHSNDEEGTG